MKFKNKIILTALLSTSVLSSELIKLYPNTPARANDVNRNFSMLYDKIKNIENGNSSNIQYPIVKTDTNIIGYYLSDNKVLSKQGYVLSLSSLKSGIRKYDTTNMAGNIVLFSSPLCSVNDTMYIQSYYQGIGTVFAIDNNIYYISKNAQIQNSSNITIYYKDEMEDNTCKEWDSEASQFDIYQILINDEAITGINNTIKDKRNLMIDIGTIQ